MNKYNVDMRGKNVIVTGECFTGMDVGVPASLGHNKRIISCSNIFGNQPGKENFLSWPSVLVDASLKTFPPDSTQLVGDLHSFLPIPFIEGANTGLGYVKAREIAKMGGSVTMACRSAERGQAALEKMREEALEKPVKEGVPLREDITDVDIKLEALDLGSLKSIQDFSKRVKASGSKIDILINNAGVMAIPDRRETADGFEMTVGINHIGTHFLTRLLEPCLADGGRVIFYSSIGHNRPPGQPKTTFNWDDINAEKPGVYRQWMSYGQSKLYNLLDAQEFAKHLSGRGITTYAVSPGVVMTELTRNMTDNSMMSVITRMMSPLMKYLISTPLQGSLTAMRCACDPTVGTPELSGKYWHNEKETKPSDLACDPANAPRLWKATEDMLEAKLGKPVSEFI